MQKNIEIFNYSLENPESLRDETYKKGELVITKTADQKNELIHRNEKLINLITSYETLKETLTDPQKDEIVDEIIDLMFNTSEKMNYTPFSQYFMVCDLSYSVVNALSEDEKRLLVKAILDDYVLERHPMYRSHGYSNIVLQVISDNYSHKRNVSTGVEKAEKQIKSRGIDEFSYPYDASKNFYLLVDANEGILLDILEKKKIKFQWSASKQGKLPDVFIQYNGKVYIIEHKHMKERGGGQSKQDTEIVDLIRYAEPNVSYVTYLDGIYFNGLVDAEGDDKGRKVKDEVVEILTANKENYFVNTAGFEKFLDEIVLA